MSVQVDEDLVLAKVAILRRCVGTIEKLWVQAEPALPDWARLDVTVLNLQRAVQACLDLTNHLIAANAWGLPGSATEAITLLVDHNVLDADNTTVYRGMIGFRNVAVHNFTTFADQILQATLNQPPTNP
jgi:uncharacterized protein YutE (UPF0331/DUF86 family)